MGFYSGPLHHQIVVNKRGVDVKAKSKSVWFIWRDTYRKTTLEQSQADLYQMLAYGVNYQEGIGDMLLIYPSHEGFSQPLPHPYEFSHQKENPLRLWVVPFFIGDSLQSSGLRFPDGKNLI